MAGIAQSLTFLNLHVRWRRCPVLLPFLATVHSRRNPTLSAGGMPSHIMSDALIRARCGHQANEPSGALARIAASWRSRMTPIWRAAKSCKPSFGIICCDGRRGGDWLCGCLNPPLCHGWRQFARGFLLEGIFVYSPRSRQRGVAARVIAAVQRWGR